MFSKKFFKKKYKVIKFQNDKVFTLIYVLVGLVFFINFFVNISIKNLVLSLMQWTGQSNLFAFFVASIYLIKPKLKIFKSNALILIAGNNLFVAAIGFWIFLFPTIFVGLNNYVLPLTKNINSVYYSNRFLFFSFWNHSVTQIFYFIFMIHAQKFASDDYLKIICLKILFLIISIWTTIWIFFFGIILTLFTNYFPIYGIFTNFNPNTIYFSSDGVRLFNLQVLIFSVILIYFASYLLGFWNWRITIQLNKKTAAKLLKNI